MGVALVMKCTINYSKIREGNAVLAINVTGKGVQHAVNY